jgi:NADH-quinone oxidoreductase subunit J
MTGTVLAAATDTGTGEAVVFWLLAPVAVLASLGMLIGKKAVHSALLLALTMMCIAVLYLAQDAPFVGVDSADSLVETLRGQRVAAFIAAIGFGALLIFAIGDVTVTNTGLTKANSDGNVEGLAALIFSKYVFAFEVTSALLITAALGAMILAHRERHTPRVTQRQLSEQRFRGGLNPAPLPGPGVYARHNAVDTPALLPDGSPADISVSRVLLARGDIRKVPGTEIAVRDVEKGDDR